jgi:hypothetical protein
MCQCLLLHHYRSRAFWGTWHACGFQDTKSTAHVNVRCCWAGLLQAFLGVIDMCRSDVYLHPHTRYYMRELRLMAYNQVDLGF